MPNRLYLGPDGRFQSAVPHLTHVHTRAHTLAGPRLTRLHTLAVPRLTRVHMRSSSPSGLPCPDSHACTHSHTHWAPTRTCARAHAGPCPGCVQTPGALCAWLRQSVVPCPHPASRIPAKDPRHVALAHPAPRLLPTWGGTAAPLRPLRPAPPGRARGRLCRRSLQVPPHRAPGSRFPLALSPEHPGLPRLLRLGFGRLWFFPC